MLSHRELGQLLQERLRPAYWLPSVLAALGQPEEAHLQRGAGLMRPADLVGVAWVVPNGRHLGQPQILQQRLPRGLGFH